MKFIFGPVASRRFGTSLGIDLSPGKKQCNFDCLYCELAPALTVEKQSESFQVSEILEQLQSSLIEHPNTEVITLTANGEPTLYPYLNELILGIDKIKGNKETLILTNSATLNSSQTYQSLLKLDQVKLSLDAVTTEVFKKIDRPHNKINLDSLIDSVISFSKEFTGKLFIEVLFVRGLNDTQEEIKALNKVLKELKCQRIDLGTIDRPPAYPIEGLNYNELFDISLAFDANLPIHIASRKNIKTEPSSYTEQEIINTLDKRPLTQDDVNILFDKVSINRLELLVKNAQISIKHIANLDFYMPSKNITRKKAK